jgi:hypothetical protein
MINAGCILGRYNKRKKNVHEDDYAPAMLQKVLSSCNNICIIDDMNRQKLQICVSINGKRSACFFLYTVSGEGFRH